MSDKGELILDWRCPCGKKRRLGHTTLTHHSAVLLWEQKWECEACGRESHLKTTDPPPLRGRGLSALFGDD